MNKPKIVKPSQSPVIPELATGNVSPPSRRRLVAWAYESSLLLMVLFNLVWNTPLTIDPASKIQPLSLLGLIIPTSVLLIPAVSVLLKVLTFIAVALWVLKRGTRWIYIVTPILFIAFMSTVVESHYFVLHHTNFCAMALVILGAAKFSGTPKQNLNVKVDPLPGWCFMLLVYYIGITYTFSGSCKLYYSGISWGDGSSLMMWIEAQAVNRDNLLFELLTTQHWLASILQTTTLIAEFFAILVLFVPRLRPVFGLVFVGFHLSIELLFDYGFYSNIFLDGYILIVCFLIPDYRINGFQFLRELTSKGQTSLFSNSGEAEIQPTV